MNGRELFGVAVRAFGLIFVFFAINRFSGVVENLMWSFSFSESDLKDGPMGFMALCIGAVILRMADSIVRFTYPEDK